MTQRKPAKGGESEKSPEFKAFEDLAKRVMAVPKEELDRREAQDKKAKGK